MDESWASLWEAVGDTMPDGIALVHGDRRLTWRELDDRAARLAGGLRSLGIGRDTKVALLAHNVPEHLEAHFAAYKLRACPINLNVRYLADELFEVLDDADAEVVVFSGVLGERVLEVVPRLAKIRAVVQIDDGSPPLDGALAYDELVERSAPVPRQVRSGEDLMLLYTGGTTGHPRGVMYRHCDSVEMCSFGAYTLAGLATPEDSAGVARCAARLADMGLTPTVLPASPLAHGMAVNLTAAAWLLGGQVVFLPSPGSFDAHELWQVVERERVTEIGIVGDAFARPMVAALTEAEQAARPYDISSVSRILSSGAPWSASTKEGLADRGTITLVETIGASEGGPTAMSVVPPGTLVEEAMFVLGDHARLLDEDGHELPPGTGQIGLLAMTPPIPFGYYKDPVKSAEVFRTIDGRRYAVCGDYARLEADGSVTFLGRGSLCINTGGEKVFCEEVEQAVRSHPAVLDANVVGLPDERFGQAVTAVVSLSPGASLTGDDVRDTVRRRLAGYKVPRHVVFVDDIPRSPTGKARYDWARDIAAETVGAAPDAGEERAV